MEECEHRFEPVPMEAGWYACTKCNCRAAKKLRRKASPVFKVFKTVQKPYRQTWIGRSGKSDPLFDINDHQLTIPDRINFRRTDKLRRGDDRDGVPVIGR